MSNVDQTIEAVLSKLNIAAELVISEYTSYQVTSSIIWTIASLVLFAVALLPLVPSVKKFIKDEWDWVLGAVAVFQVLFFVVALFIFSFNVSTLVNPRAEAIHQLLVDLNLKR